MYDTTNHNLWFCIIYLPLIDSKFLDVNFSLKKVRKIFFIHLHSLLVPFITFSFLLQFYSSSNINTPILTSLTKISDYITKSSGQEARLFSEKVPQSVLLPV